MKRALLVVLIAGCHTFQPEEIVIDTRVLAMASDIPDQVITVDLTMGEPQPADLLEQLVPSTTCALVGDPAFDRGLHYQTTLCIYCNDTGGCCDTPRVPLASGRIDDPELAQPEPQLCATVQPDGNLLGVVLAALDGDTLKGLGGIDYIVELRVGGDGDDPALDQVATKTLRVVPNIPANRSANHNPTIDHFDAAPYDPQGNHDVNQPLPMGRCVDQTAPLELVPTQRVRFTPVEPADGSARETYVLPTIDGKSETFTESLTYQWLATAGSFSSGSTGGPRDVATGDPAPLFTDYRAPSADELTGPTDITLWMVQRDERLGAVWYESCVRVVP